MIALDLLKNHPSAIPALAAIWQDVLGKMWAPEVSLNQVEARFTEHLNDETLPLTFVAFDGDTPVGMVSLRHNDGIRPELSPWLGSLVVDREYQRQGIGNMLMSAVKDKAKELGCKDIYLFTFDPTLPKYYDRLSWRTIGMDIFKGHPVTVMKMVI